MSQWNETCSQSPANREKFDPPTPTPLERLERWVNDPDFDREAEIGMTGTYSCVMRQWDSGRASHYWDSYDHPTLDAAILAALAQAEGER